jgi:hypothetical protein
VASFSGDPIADRYPRLDQLQQQQRQLQQATA